MTRKQHKNVRLLCRLKRLFKENGNVMDSHEIHDGLLIQKNHKGSCYKFDYNLNKVTNVLIKCKDFRKIGTTRREKVPTQSSGAYQIVVWEYIGD